MNREEKEIMEIKKSGNLIAVESSWQYWILNNVIYSISVSGTHYSIWCNVSDLNRHLHRLYQITGKKYFTGGDMVIVDPEFLKKFSYA